ncbi:uncharacterized protein EDB93DRAFT_1097115, partial [Suillus bovinus]|uniref:uncharacterized protein n=1 Tax=Suillus bovinus TaxID=48563 RepID=UPI001B867FE8
LKATMVMADPNACGQCNNTLVWFWSINVQGDSTSSDWMNECVHFAVTVVLMTLALHDRWAEELLLVGLEMAWTVNFLTYKSQQWIRQIQKANANDMASHRCHATRQAQIYVQLSQQAQNSFERTKCMAGGMK